MLRPVLASCAVLLATGLSTGSPIGSTLGGTLATAAAPSNPTIGSAPPRAAAQPSELELRRAEDVETPAEPLRIPLPRGLLIAPRGCAALGPTFDVLLHFHGAYTTTEPQLMKSGINAVYVVKNLGNLSGPYESAYASPRAFDAEIESIRARINRSCAGPARSVGRIALSGWSAGYGAIQRILARPEAAARVDAVLMADGMHAGYEPGSRRVRGAAMAPFVEFGAAAARGEKLMAVTHSAIVPPSYASTTETARFLVDELNLAPANAPSLEPRSGMRLTSYDQRGDFHVAGYAGADAPAHCDHLYAISTTLWSRLRQRWQRR